MLRKIFLLTINCRIILLLSLLVSSPYSLAFEAQIAASGESVAASTDDQGVKFLSLKVWDAKGIEVFSKTSNGARVTWAITDDINDGRYKYEVKLSSVAAGSRSRGSSVENEDVRVSTQSGSVMVQSGSIVTPAQEEIGTLNLFENSLRQVAVRVLDFLVSPAHADIVQDDDVITRFSHCIGRDCNDGESFGSDSLRLKENNLRIHFDDTSNTASFPNNDWRIIINDSTNGGSNFFGVEDSTAGRNIFTLEAGAPSNSLFIDSRGFLGLGTSNPTTAIEAVTGNNPILRLNQDGSQGFQAQTWDLGGNEGGFFVRDVTNGSALPFQISSGAPTDSFIVSDSGNIGVGINSPTEKLHVIGNAIVSGNLELGSSRAIKNQIKGLGLGQAMQAFQSLEPVMFRYKHSPNEQSIGFIAEDVPDLVATQNRKGLKPMDIIAVLTKVVQEQQKTIDALSNKVEGLLEEKVVEQDKR